MSNTNMKSQDSAEILEKIEDGVAILLDGGNKDRDTIINFVRTVVASQHNQDIVTENGILQITKRLEARFDISMGLVICFLRKAIHHGWMRHEKTLNGITGNDINDFFQIKNSIVK